MTRYFITGTDTDCGKTYATCQLLTYLQHNNRTVHALKPVASGCQWQDSVLVSEDEYLLNRHQTTKTKPSHVWRFEKPVSPHIAAQDEGQVIDMQHLIQVCEPHDDDCLLIEGAGGLMVPLNGRETWLDFLIQTKIPVILVVGMRLGCINHALLTDMVLKTNHIEVTGWIANCLDKDMLHLEDNMATLSQKMGCQRLGVIPYQGHFNPDPCIKRVFNL